MGLGADMRYDFSQTPSSRLFLNKGSFSGLTTTDGQGYMHWYDKYRYSDDLVVKMQLEHWSDNDFYRDFYYSQYRNRTTPRSFVFATPNGPRYSSGASGFGSHDSW